MERLVNGRLMHFIEERGLMASCQSGFRKGRSTMDSIICLEDEIRKAQVKKETVVAVFLDVEKAYGMGRGSSNQNAYARNWGKYV